MMSSRSSSSEENDTTTVKKVPLGASEIEQFVELLIRALFTDNIKKGTNDEGKVQVYNEIRALCLVRGINGFVEDLDGTDDDFVGVMSHYATNSSRYIQSVANKTLGFIERWEAGEKTDPTDEPTQEQRRLLDFFHEHGIEETVQRVEKDPFLAALRDFARGQGIPDGLFDKVVVLALNEDDDDAAAPKKNTSREYHGVSLGYWVVCPKHGRQLLNDDEYTEQLLDPERGFRCPRCDAVCELERELDDEGQR
jgi:hypothetical protein